MGRDQSAGVPSSHLGAGKQGCDGRIAARHQRLPKFCHDIPDFGAEWRSGRRHHPDGSCVCWIGSAAPPKGITSRLSGFKVRLQLRLENPSCKEGQPSDILLKSALRAENRPRIRIFSPRSGVSAACLKGRVHFEDFSCFIFRLHSKSDRLLVGFCSQSFLEGPLKSCPSALCVQHGY